MKHINYWPVALAVVLLSGCDQLSRIVYKNSVEVSALPIIEQEITTLVPLFNGKRNKAIMDHICAYASGRDSVNQYNSFFTDNKINIDELAKEDAGFHFLSVADKNDLTTSCAAFIASTFFTQQALLGDVDPETPREQIQNQLKNLTPIALVVINKLAEIAAIKQDKNYASIEKYKDDILQQFTAHAPALIDETLNSRFTLSEYESQGPQNGISYNFDKGQVGIYLYGDQWLGNGKIMGVRYSIYIDAAKTPVDSTVKNNDKAS